jgi:hypothetical protein
MLTSSKDLFLIVLSFCAIWILFLITIGAYYMLQIVREMKKMVMGFRQRLDAVDQFVKTAKDKLEHTSALMQVMVEWFTKLAGYMIEKKVNAGKKKKKDSDE